MPPRFAILEPVPPRFSELNKVKVTPPSKEEWEGYVIESRVKDGRWIYKLSMTEDPKKSESFDCWFPEDWLERIK